jgi:hypothetical protein
MPFGIFINIKTELNRDSSFRYNEVIPENNYVLPIEVSKLIEIGVGFKRLNTQEELKIKVFKISDYLENNKTEFDMLNDFYNMFNILNQKSLIKNDMFLIGYDIKKYVLPSLLKLLIVKHKIVEYKNLPEFIKIKDLKPWDTSNVIDIKDELSFGGYYVNFDYFKFFNNVKTNSMEDELILLSKFI